MGCSRFLGCFLGTSKHSSKKHLRNSNNSNFETKYNPLNQTVSAHDFRVVEPRDEKLNVTNLRKQEEQLRFGAQKRLTFDSNAKEYAHLSCNEAPQTFEVDEKRAEADSTKPDKSSCSSESGSTSSSSASYPPNHRYQNFRESDDEVSELDDDENALNEDEDGHDDVDDDGDGEEAYSAEYSDDECYSRQAPEISTKSCPSADSGTKSSTTCASNDSYGDEPTKDIGSLDKETNTPPVFNRGARDRTGYVHSVLNPVENTAQWKNVKAKQTPSMKYLQKENSQMDPGPTQSSSKHKSKPVDPGNTCEVTVGASLSTWLDSSQKTPLQKPTPISMEPISSPASISSQGSNLVRTKEEKPKMGTLTTEEFKQFSASSPRRSPSRSPSEKPLVGTIGIHQDYGNDRTPVEDSSSSSSFKGIPNTTSKYREDKRVTWHSTPFATRLERALNKR
ncbi:hypothetical protein vseg_010450 [Gypsophila vaccaria]